MREAKILFGNQWVEVDFRSIKKGDVFRVFEDGVALVDKGTITFVATSDAYYSDDWETYMVEYEEYYGGIR